MRNTPYVRAVIAHAALELVPPLIRESLLDESGFKQEYGFKTEAVLTFSDPGVSIQRSEIFGAVREALAGTAEREVTDINGCEWTLRNETETEQAPKFAISSGEQRLDLPDLAVLSPDAAVRLRSLDEAAADVNLPANAQERWRKILRGRALEDDEVALFHHDLHDTPVHSVRAIRREIRAGQSSVSSLIPSSRRYFERLVGAYDGSVSIRDYAAGSGKDLFEQLAGWRPYEGFVFSLLLSSHSALTAEIPVDRVKKEDLSRAYHSIESDGDIMSRLGAIEVGLRILPEHPEIAPFVVRLIEQIRDDDVDGSSSAFKLFAALFVLVDGELSRTRLLSAMPPFYRKLASLSHAALIHRQSVGSGVERDQVCEWALNSRGEQYYMQSLSDMRMGPRWNPDLASARQMKAECFGRVMLAATQFEVNLKGSELHRLILGSEPRSLLSLSEFPAPYFPGPLEGAEDSPNALPADLSTAIKAHLSTDEVQPSSFVALINSAMIFYVDSGQAELAARALELGNYRLANLEDRSQLIRILNGLATVAATARSVSLADELRILVRRYRRDSQYGFSIEEELRICLIAAASRADLTEWRDFAGEWLTELAFGEFEGDEGTLFHSHLQCLCHAVPELWVSCGKADAALMAVNGY